jgi:carbamoyl-phosphate synthase large subunit
VKSVIRMVVRPSYVLGGRAMEIVHEEEDLRRYMREAVQVSNESPVLLDRFLERRGRSGCGCPQRRAEVIIGGIMEHIEEAGVHSGDSACSLPPYSLSPAIQDRMREQVRAMALELGVVGLMNTQFAIQGDDIYVLGSQSARFPHRSLRFQGHRTTAGQDRRPLHGWAHIGSTRGVRRGDSHLLFRQGSGVSLRQVPRRRPLLGPEMKSTGEVMGVGRTFGEAFAKAQLGAGDQLPRGGQAFISVRDADKARAVEIARDLDRLGFTLVATKGTALALRDHGLACQTVHKVGEGRPHVVDLIKNDQIALIVNTTEGKQAIADSFSIRREALDA